MQTAIFQPGRTYTTRLATSHSTVLSYEVVTRTRYYITIRDWRGQTSRVGVKLDDGREFALPDGKYSMAPVIFADRYVGAIDPA